MSYADIINGMFESTNNYGKKALQLYKVELYGRIRCAVEHSNYLLDLNIRKGFPVIVDLLAIKCVGEDYFGPSGTEEIDPKTYKAYGSVVAICENPDLVGQFATIGNTRGGGVNLRFGDRRGSTAEKANSVNCLKFWKGDQGDWIIFPNDFIPFEDSAPSSVLKMAASQDSGTSDLIYEEDPGFRPPYGLANYTPILAPGAEVALPPVTPFNGTTEEPVVGTSSNNISRVIIQGAEYEGAPTPHNMDVSAPASGVSVKSVESEEDAPQPLVHRMDVAPRFEYETAFQGEIDRCKESRSEYLEEIEGRLTGIENPFWRRNAVIAGFNEAFVKRMYDSTPGMRLTRKSVVMDLAEKLSDKKTSKDEIVITLESKPSSLVDGSSSIALIEDKNYLFAAIVDTVAGTRLVSKGEIKDKDSDEKFDSKVVQHLLASPYDAAIVHGLGIEDADKLFFLLSPLDDGEWFNEEQFRETRDTLIVKSILEDEGSPSSLADQREVVTKGIQMSKKVSDAIRSTDTPFDGFNYGKVQCILEDGLRPVCRSGKMVDVVSRAGSEMVYEAPDYTKLGPWSGVKYTALKWLRGDKANFRPYSGFEVLETLDKRGIAVQVGSEIISSSYMEMEEFVYQKTYSLGQADSGVTADAIERAIKEYEEEKGFQLEDLQKEGIQLVTRRGGVLSGQAGSGKTTVSEVMVKALKYGLPQYEVKFAAPTGKAARRMKEVLGDLGEVRTLHSLFKLGIGTPDLFSEGGGSPKAAEENIVYILDEMAMCTTSLLYQVLKRISDSSMIFFLGDVKQLPPIGKGMPFRDMMNYMPAIELGVSKRAKEGSGINYNCDLINQKSYNSNFENLESRDDFKLIPADDAKIVETVLAGVKNNAKKMNPDDIQVATPYATPKKPWSSTNLNPALQDIFLEGAPALFTHAGERTFKLGARAIHVRKNLYGKKRYHWDSDNKVLQQALSHGVVNGELGYLIGLVKATDVEIVEDEEYDSRVQDEENVEMLPDDVEDRKLPKTWFVLFEVDDPDINQKVVVLYHAEDLGGGETEFTGRDLRGSDLSNLELAYALTVHKLQGSQAKMIIIPLGARDNANFVSRNMVYTAVSRAQETVVLVGSVGGSSSMLNASRRNTTVHGVRSVHSIMSGVKDMKG